MARRDRGLVYLMAHVEPELRERVRAEAAYQEQPISGVVASLINLGLVTLAETRERQAARRRRGGGCRG